MGGVSTSPDVAMLCWKRIYDVMSNASNTAGKPTAVSAQLQSFYKAHLLAYQQAHPEDVFELLCPFCGKTEPPAGTAMPNARWNMVWTECSSSAACGQWLHRACGKAAGTIKRAKTASPDGEHFGTELRVQCPACILESGAEVEPATLERRPSDEQAAAAKARAAARRARAPPPVAAGGPRYVQLLPARPNMSSRVFSTHQARCVPLLDSAERCDQLLRAAQDVLCASGLTAELVASSLGFARDDMDVSFKTVALLVSGDAVLSALVFCEDAHGNAAQVLVAGTSPHARREGCMRQLLQESADWLAAKGVNTMCVGTTRANTAAAAVYVKLGFVPSSSGWPAGMVPKRTSSDLRDVWVLSRGQAAAAGGGSKRADITPDKGDARRARASADAALGLPLSGPPPEWPDEVPFTSGCVWEGQPPELWPQVPCHDVVVKLITSADHPCCGAYGLFARRDLLPTGDLLAYGGATRAACDSESLFLADCGGGCDVDAELCGNEARYLNDYFGIAPQANAVLESREAHLTGSRYVVGRLIAPVRAGEELLLDYGVDYPRHRFAKPKRRRLVDV